MFRPDLHGFPVIVLVGAVPAVAMVAMLRCGAPPMPHAAVALAGLASAGPGNFGLRLFHAQDPSPMVLVWRFGGAAVLTGLAGSTGRWLINWRSVLSRPAWPMISGRLSDHTQVRGQSMGGIFVSRVITARDDSTGDTLYRSLQNVR